MSIEYLVEKYGKLVYKICYDMLENPLDAEDITQEVYINLYSSLYKYKDLKENEIKNLICKIALNKCKDYYRSKASKLERISTNDTIILENYIEENGIEQEIIRNDENNNIKKIILGLKEPYRKILYYYYIDEYSLDNIARKIGVTKGTLKMQIYRGKKILKEELERRKLL